MGSPVDPRLVALKAEIDQDFAAVNHRLTGMVQELASLLVPPVRPVMVWLSYVAAAREVDAVDHDVVLRVGVAAMVRLAQEHLTRNRAAGVPLPGEVVYPDPDE